MTPFNKNPQTPRGKKIVAQLRASCNVGKCTSVQVQKSLGTPGSCSGLGGSRCHTMDRSPSPCALDKELVRQARTSDSVEAEAGPSTPGHTAASRTVDAEPCAAFGSVSPPAAKGALDTLLGHKPNVLVASAGPCADSGSPSPMDVGLDGGGSAGAGRLHITLVEPPVDRDTAMTRVEGSTSPAPSPMPTPLRRSERHVVAVDGSSATDEDSMVRAMRRKVEQNLDMKGMRKTPKSFLPFSIQAYLIN